MLSLYMSSKIFHFVYLTIILTGNVGDYRSSNPEIERNYPPEDPNPEEMTDAGCEQLKNQCYVVIAQYIVVMLVIAVAMVLTRKTNHYIHVLAWLIALVQLCELPFHPVFPFWYLFITSSWVFASYFFLTVLSFQTLYQAVPILLILLVGLPLRMYLLVDVTDVPYGFLTAFIVLSFAISIMISIDVVSSAKLVFKQLFEMHRQKECFRTIMSSFPEGVMIAKVTQLEKGGVGQSIYGFNKDGPTTQRGSLHQEQQQNSAEHSEGDGSGEEEAPEIRVDVLFMNQHLQKFLGAKRGKGFNP